MLVTRRIFLSSVAALALPLPAVGQITRLRAPPISFGGNPNVTITAIDASRGIACSRTSGLTPCFIQVSASNITATGTSVPYEDLSYSWDFGDRTGIETFTNPATGTVVNANSAQTGPEAAYCYRSAGTYTVTLTITGKNGGGYTTTTCVQSIVVSAFVAANTWYYDANATGANNGSSPTDAYTALFSIITNVNGATGATQIFMARGSHWISNAYVTLTPAGAVRFTPYGSGADPIMECNTQTSNPGQNLFSIYAGGGHNVSDIVISHLSLIVSGNSFTGNAVALAGSIIGTTYTLSDVYFDNCSVSTNLSSPRVIGWLGFQANSTTASGQFDRCGYWGGSVNSLNGDLAYGIGIFGGARNWTFIFGLTNVNGSGGATFTGLVHHIYATVGTHALYRWINFGSGPNRNYCVKVDNYPSPKYNITGNGPCVGGVVRVTVATTAQYTSGGSMYVELVTGTTEANGIWIGTVVDSTHIDLAGTTYVNAWVSGGDISPATGTSYWLVDSNNITGTARSFDANNNFGDSFASWVAGYVIQNNIVHNFSYDSLMLVPIALSLTYRGNNHWANITRQVYPSQGRPKNNTGMFRIYRNKFYIPSSVSGGSIDTSCVSFYANNGSWANRQQFTDNIIQDMRTGAAAVGLNSYSAQAALGSTIDRNQYYAPNATASKFLYNNSTSTTFATWQAAGFDANGSVACPHWTDPAIGNFTIGASCGG